MISVFDGSILTKAFDGCFDSDGWFLERMFSLTDDRVLVVWRQDVLVLHVKVAIFVEKSPSYSQNALVVYER